ncbi:MAG: ABC transporter ATP-binding protein [Candidatus Competibacter sp.]|nr:ABC transporter ATP-binding protein [Candidatus Competibacter sp.]MDG4604556.1 ABC transporter ATP-binding protein [Candidatus Contendobacter sp.]HRD48220.1 ABC transporter ATP-binding protein [Candidatus Contendobacter sp.]
MGGTHPALRVRDLSKVYRLYDQPMDRLKELLFRQRRHTDFTALQGVSFELPHGRTLGVVGDNGAGKSTLLQLIAGTLTPTGGIVERDGAVLGLLELGVGFHAEFTGRQNIFLYGDVLGLPRRLLQDRFDEIVAFAELEAFIDRPLKTYSTGMRMRLAFSLIASLDPDLLIVDEALSVGDVYFQKKCIDRMMEFKNRGRAILFCSHSLYQVSMFCDETLWLREGRIHLHGETHRVIPVYEAWQAQRNAQRQELEAGMHSDLPARIVSLELLNELPCRRGDDLRFRLRLESARDDLPFHVTLSIKMDDGRGVYVTGTHLSGQPPLRGRQREILITYPCVPLLGGLYSAHARIFDDQGLMVYHEKVLPDLEVRKDSHELGICYLENRWEIH